MKTRFGFYIINGLFLLVCQQFMGFELAVIVGMGIIIGELHYGKIKEKEQNKRSSNDDSEFIP